MTYLERLELYIDSKNYKSRTHLHWLRDCLRKILLNGVYYPGNIYADIDNYIKREKNENN